MKIKEIQKWLEDNLDADRELSAHRLALLLKEAEDSGKSKAQVSLWFRENWPGFAIIVAVLLLGWGILELANYEKKEAQHKVALDAISSQLESCQNNQVLLEKHVQQIIQALNNRDNNVQR